MCFLESEGPTPMRDVGSIHKAKGSRPGGGRYNAFVELPTLTSSAFFGQDEMHLLGHGTGHQLYQALGGKFCPGTAGLGRKSHGMHLQERLQRLEYPFALDVSLDDIEKAVSTSRADIPMAFTGTWRSMKESNGKRKTINWMDFLLFIVPTMVINHLCFADAKQAVRDLVLACFIVQQWSITTSDIVAVEAIGHWHSFLRCKISDGKLKSNIFVMNQHMLVHLGFMLWEMGPLQAYSCRPIEYTIGTYTSAIKSRKEPGKNMENVLFQMAAISHCRGNCPARTGPADRRTSNFKVASDDIAGPQLWSSLTRYSMAELANTIGMEWKDLVQQLLPFWAGEGVSSFEEQDSVVCTTKMWKDSVVYRVQSSFDSRHVQANNLVVLKHMWDYGFVRKFFSHIVKGVTRLFAATESLSDVRPLPGMLFPVSSNCSQGEMRIVDVKSFKGMAGLVHDTKDGAIRHIVWPLPTHNQ
ncbi:hypothetical protein PHYBLDRAFT_171014 [Phycomyces blakesleeanus NRRL 1555(-)]|uniref:DUF4218 domain-containing protein n=1 Tax=Phycomyces blakesleeanus (strain ATCC 8743b / DSM 1359 / FGSC 10004 / NBRC 33097 / NRRL 1555) TaxID=763407 RepID=A0A162TTU7_PHYB8|nr:hypothetical protein PHYBLDRAFT_171014 [Phycomyces blakesleeanus NRRL 1555(-)]OAD70942.1 hypothetical protein PHYBLDRAFT_171014 [Phycomyces blakesleeanus NRRL 1555(-)]|eukprot:XP_018288982.1 hypothetical protein PHYBLDRAFT_171014 [Phycomyces blakesleeanus NRRL 1555(-)]